MSESTQIQAHGAKSLYHPLQDGEIRCLRLLASHSADEIRLSLEIRNLDQGIISNEDAFTYEALSYEWGDPAQPRHSIYINEQEMSIRLNLWLALKYIARSNVLLWADALCINQDDVEERAQQLAIMGDIFAGAEQVRVWLGEYEQLSSDPRQGSCVQEACVYVTRYGSSYYGSPAGVRSAPTRPFPKSLVRSGQKIPDVVLGLLDLLERTYWTRLWILQEFVLARALLVHCGSSVMEEDNLVACASEGSGVLNRLSFLVRDPNVHARFRDCPARKILRMRQMSRLRAGDSAPSVSIHQLPLHDMLSLSRGLKCSVPHDRIYGLLGLIAQFDRSLIPLDYAISIADLKQQVAACYEDRTDLDEEAIQAVLEKLDGLFADCV